MAKGKDKITVILGIIYCTIASFCVIFLFATIGGAGAYSLGMFGIFCLVPSLILFLVFICSMEGGTSAAVGFGLGIPAWAFGLLGHLLNWGYVSFHASDVFVVICNIALIFLGSILFSRRTLWSAPPPTCPDCNRPVRYIAQYGKYYCDQCKKYMDIISR